MIGFLRVLGYLVAGLGAVSLGSAFGRMSSETVGVVSIATVVSLGAFVMPGVICVGIAEVLAGLRALRGWEEPEVAAEAAEPLPPP